MKSKLEELIEKLCPNGVEYKLLKDISIMQRGKGVTKKELKIGNIPVISGGKEPAYYNDKFNREGETITVAGSGANAGYIQYWNKEIFVADAFSIKGIDNVSTKYLFYNLINIQNYIYSLKTGGGIPHIYISTIENIPFPLPPIEIQEEIVRILDKFTELITELTTELTLRKQQYEYYRDELLTFGDEVEWKSLGEIGEVKMCKRILKNQTTFIGDIPFYKIGTFGKNPDAYISRNLFEEYREKYSYPKKGEILISASGTIGRTVIFNGEDSYFQDSNIVWIDNDENQILNKYLFYYYKIIKWAVAEGGTIKRLYNDIIRKTQIPVPPLEEQQRIVDILDRFDKLVNDIKEGLPAEIEMRQKQYEYYRDKLLNFKKLNVEG